MEIAECQWDAWVGTMDGEAQWVSHHVAECDGMGKRGASERNRKEVSSLQEELELPQA